MSMRSRRKFFADVGQGMMIAALGSHLAADLGLAAADAELTDDADRLDFGELEPLVALMQDTEPSRLLPKLAGKLKGGTSLHDLVGAAALANARTFGGEDYVGFHTMMALTPSFRMAGHLEGAHQALPVLKVLYRNSRRIQEHGGRDSEVLRKITATLEEETADGVALREAVRKKDVAGAERIFAAIAQGPVDEAFNQLLMMVEDNTEVHRIVLPYRARDLVEIVGAQHAHTLLRQSVRYCLKSESQKYRERSAGGRDVLPVLLDEYRLLSKPRGTTQPDDAWVSGLADTIFASDPEQSAEAVAAALAEGFAAEAIGEALSLAANQLVLRDAGRPAEWAQSEKPIGSVHGDSVGVHASDSIHAWRAMAGLTNDRHRVSCLILGAYQVARDREWSGGDFLSREPYPTAEHLEHVRAESPGECLKAAEVAIRENDQARTCAAVLRYSELSEDAKPVIGMLLKYAVSEDGALHAEKYFETATSDFSSTRPSLRWRHLLGLARVTASAYGYPAPGIEEASRLLEG